MKKKNREVSVFSVSALDLFCSAMGVFMILFFINMSQSGDAQDEDTPALSLHLYLEITAEDASTPSRTWHAATHHDVDMVITAEAMGEVPAFRYTPDKENRQHKDSPALYMTDGHNGQPDIWLHPQITPGNYQASFTVSRRINLNNNALQCNENAFTEETVRVYSTVKTADNDTEGTQHARATSFPYVIRGYRVKLVAIKNGTFIGSWVKEMSPSELKLGTSAPLANITVTSETLTITPNEGVNAVEQPQQDFLQSDRF